MSKAKSTRTWLAALVAVCLLFAQIATAAYACPLLSKASMPSGIEAVVAMPDCDAMPVGQLDNERPSLCKAHCQSSQQSHESKGASDAQLLALDVLSSLAWILPPVRESNLLVVSVNDAAERPPGSPSLYLVNQVFRL